MHPSKAPELQILANRIGDFMKYWGFSKIDGRIWTHLYLSPQAMSASELGTRLNVSKALLSSSLNQLLHFGVIRVAKTAKHGTSLYESAPNLIEAVENVIRSREMQMLADISASARLLEQATKHSSAKEKTTNDTEAEKVQISASKATQLREMCESAEAALKALLNANTCLATIANFSLNRRSY